MNRLHRMLLMGAAALAGCVTPPADTPQQRPVEATALGLAEIAVAPAPDGWWRAYGDAQLDRLIARALAHSPSLQQAAARVRQASALTDERAAQRAARISLDGTEQRARFSERDIIPPPYGGKWYWRGDAEVNLSWDLDFWGRQAALIESASNRAAAAQLDLEASRLMLSGAMARSYLQLDRAWRLADLAARTQAQRERLADLTRRRVTAGLDTQVELRTADALVPLARVQYSQAQADIELAVHALAALTADGALAYADITRPQLALDVVPPLPSALPANLLARRPDVLAARLRLQAADADRVAARAAFYPDVNLSAFVGFAAIGLDNLFVGDAQQLGAGPRFHLPIIDAKRLKAEFRAANAQIDSAVADYNATVLHAVQQVADELTLIDAAQRELTDQQLALDHAEAAYALAEKRYRAGLATQLNVLNAETQVLAARRQRVDLIDSLARSRVALLLALGGSFDPARPAAAAPAELAATASDHSSAVSPSLTPPPTP